MVLAEGYRGEKKDFGQDPWPELYEAMRHRLIMQGEVLGVERRDGRDVLVIPFGHVRGVLPEEEIGDTRPRSLVWFAGRTVAFKVKHCDRAKNEVHLSRKDALEEMSRETWRDLKSEASRVMELRAELSEAVDDLRRARAARDAESEPKALEKIKLIRKQMYEAGPVRTCVVKWVTERGAYVDIGGVLAVIPKNELSHGLIGDPSEVVKPGDCFDVKVYDVDPETGRVRASLRALLPDPWLSAERKYSKGGLYRGTVVSETRNSGLIVEFEPGVRCWVRKPEYGVVVPGDGVLVKLSDVDVPNRRSRGFLVKVVDR